MVYRPNVDAKSCFVLLPLRSPFLGYFEKIIKPAVLAVGLIAVKADEIYGTRAVIRDIWEQIWKARAVVAIVTDKNPNVNYELGICHTLGIPTVLITERQEDVPFDYRHRRYIRYLPKEADWQQKLIEDLTNTLKAILTEPNLALADDLPWPYDTYEMDTSERIGQLLTADKARSTVIKGAELVSRLLVPAFGPHGTRVSVLDRRLNRQATYRQGARISEGIASANHLESQGIAQMRRLSRDMINEVGDLSKVAVFLCVEMLKGADAALKEGHKPKHLISGMRRATEVVTGFLMTHAKQVAAEQRVQVAQTASGGDEIITTAVVEALDKAGDDGVVQVVEGDGNRITIESQEGMSFDQGFLSPFFITDQERQECVLEDSFVLIYDSEIKSMTHFLPILERVAKSRKPLLIIARDVSGEALATLVLNKEKGVLAPAAVRTPGFGDNRDALLEDIGILTGAKPFLEEVMKPLADIELSELGKSKKIVITKNTTTFIGGAGSSSKIAARIKQLKMEISRTKSDYEGDRLRDRLAKFGAGIVVLRAAGRTPDDQVDARYKVDSALRSCISSIENGCVAGGGATYLATCEAVKKLVPKNDAEEVGIEIVAEALASPLRILAGNANGQHPDEIVKEIRKRPSVMLGFNAETGKVEDVAASGILDSAKALSEAMLLSFAYAEGIIGTAAWDSTPDTRLEDRERS